MVQNLEQSSAFSLTGSPKQVSYRVTPCHLRESSVHYFSNKSVTQEKFITQYTIVLPLVYRCFRFKQFFLLQTFNSNCHAQILKFANVFNFVVSFLFKLCTTNHTIVVTALLMSRNHNNNSNQDPLSNRLFIIYP